MKRFPIIARLSLLVLFLGPVSVLAAEDLLDPEQAFALNVQSADSETVVAEWNIAEGYYLYRKRMSFESASPGIQLGEPAFPTGKVKDDEFFGKVEIYRHDVLVEIPITRDAGAPDEVQLKVVSQGCADSGVCYPPNTRTVAVALLPSAIASSSETRPSGGSLLLVGQPEQEELLDPEDAYRLSLTASDGQTLVAAWDIADGYYLYRDKISVELVDSNGVRIAEIDIPRGKPKEDEFFGTQEVFYHDAAAIVILARDNPAIRDVTVKVGYQGCAEIGVCYPPSNVTLPVRLSVLQSAAAQPPQPVQPIPSPQPATATQPAPSPVSASAAGAVESEQGMIADYLQENRFGAMPLFFGFGLLLAFTPCIFPMIPILSCLIVGQGENITRWQGFMLSVIYVLTMAITYTVAGVLAALLGGNIQAMFQDPIVLTAFSAVFVALSFSMFGFYDLQLPSSWQSRLTEVSNRQGGGSYAGVAIMGLLSALIVGPCVAPPLIGVLAVIGATGDAFLGGTALFVMSLGMGAPLLLIGASASHFLPRAGMWMDQVKAVFGVLLLAVAIWMLERILPEAVSMLLWAVLLILSAVYMGALQSLGEDAPAARFLLKGLGIVLLSYGILLLVGIAAGGKDPLQPLRGVGLVSAQGESQKHMTFKTIKTVGDLEEAIKQANGRPVVLDFYADWCVSCKELEKYTFGDPEVQSAFAQSNVVLLQADVTENDSADQELLRRFGIIGPPAILFFGADGQERAQYRVVGYMPAEEFTGHFEAALRA